MGGLIFILGLVGFAGGILAVFALIAERDANMRREETDRRMSGGRDRGLDR